MTVDGTYLGAVLRLGAGRPGQAVRRPHRRMARRDRRGGKKRVTLTVVRAAARARAGARPLAAVRADQARPDRLAGREGDRARRRPAACRCSPAGRSSTGSTSSGCAPMRSRRPSNASAPRFPSWPSRGSSTRCSTTGRPTARSTSPTKRGGEPFAPDAGPGRDPDRPRGRLHRRGARRDPRPAPGPPGLARPAHPARRHRRARRGQRSGWPRRATGRHAER